MEFYTDYDLVGIYQDYQDYKKRRLLEKSQKPDSLQRNNLDQIKCNNRYEKNQGDKYD